MRFFSLLVMSLISIPASSAHSAVFVNMVGTVERGNLNGVDLAGTLFSYEAIVLDTTDIDDVFPNTGTFVVDTAVLDFGTRGIYDFGNTPGFFNWGIDQGAFYAYAVLEVDVPTTNYDHGFGLVDNNTALSNFDSAVLGDFGPYADFDGAFTFDDISVGTFSGNNGMGDTLEFSQLAPSGILTVAAVPEPSALLSLLSVTGVAAFVRRRKKPRCPMSTKVGFDRL